METNSSSCDLPTEVIDHVVNMWVDVLKTPIPASGHFTEDDNFINVSTTWSVVDPGKKEAVRFQRNASVLKKSVSWNNGATFIEKENLIMNETAATPIDGCE